MSKQQSKPNKPVQNLYSDHDFDLVQNQIKEVMRLASEKAQEVMEPTIHEKREIIVHIFDFIRNKKRKIYGGTAMNALIREKNPKDCIYTDTEFADIDFYSPKPVFDLVDLTNDLHKKGYKHVQGKEAQHDESFSIYVNMHLYCQITYVSSRVYRGIQTIVIDDIYYTHPHFIYIDQLRMFNDPMNSSWRWEKAFSRSYLLLKYYPLEDNSKQINITVPNVKIAEYIAAIKSKFMMEGKNQNNCMITGFDAYNFFIRNGLDDKNVEKMARPQSKSSDKSKLTQFLTVVPFMELISVNYRDTVKSIFVFLQNIVEDKSLLNIEEYAPLFQFFNHMTIVTYNKIPIVKIYEADGMCISMIKTTKGYSYVSYQYMQMFLLINRFRAFLDENKEFYFIYSSMFSNIITARNEFLDRTGLEIINKSVFGEFRISCMGTTMSLIRAGLIRRTERISKGHAGQLTYEPKRFVDKPAGEAPKFEPTRMGFKNTSGNIIKEPKYLMFEIDQNGILIDRTDIEEFSSNESESESDVDSPKS